MKKVSRKALMYVNYILPVESVTCHLCTYASFDPGISGKTENY